MSAADVDVRSAGTSSHQYWPSLFELLCNKGIDCSITGAIQYYILVQVGMVIVNI